MKEEARLLTMGWTSDESAKMARLLTFFGIDYRVITVADFLSERGADGTCSRFRLFCSAEVFDSFLYRLDRVPDGDRLWQEQIHSIFIYTYAEICTLEKLVRRLANNPEISLRQPDA